MNDLISRYELLKLLTVNPKGQRIREYDCDNFPITITLHDIKKLIREQPIAYDVDKVVEQLQIMADEANDKIIEANSEGLYYDGYEDGINDAIEIVKEGGVNE